MSSVNTRLFYCSPAAYWEAALPIGNGRIGAMIFGGVEKEEIDLNEDTLWSGLPEKEYTKNLWTVIPEVRTAVAHRHFYEADRLVTEKMTDHDCQSYLPAGKLNMDFQLHGKPENYSRKLDLETAVAETKWSLTCGPACSVIILVFPIVTIQRTLLVVLPSIGSLHHFCGNHIRYLAFLPS